MGQSSDLQLQSIGARLVRAEVLPWTICLPTLVLIAQAVFLLERGQTDKQTDATECPTPRWRLYSRRG